MQAQNLSSSQFADRIGVQRSGLSHILSGRNNPSLDFVLKVLAAFPDINPVWLLQGKGKMYDTMTEQKTLFPMQENREWPADREFVSDAQANEDVPAKGIDASASLPLLKEKASPDIPGKGSFAPSSSLEKDLEKDSGVESAEAMGSGATESLSGASFSGKRREEDRQVPSGAGRGIEEGLPSKVGTAGVSGNNGRKALARIVFFFQDGSFREYFPEERI